MQFGFGNRLMFRKVIDDVAESFFFCHILKFEKKGRTIKSTLSLNCIPI